MSESEVQNGVHTPGPWKRYEGFGADSRRPIIVDSIPDRDGKCMANCICYVATTNADYAANARLIAAAPELLAACRELIEAMNDYGWSVDDPPTPKHQARMLRAVSAVEKATNQGE